MIKAAIIGGAGYTAGELIRILINHPHVELCYVQSESHEGESVGSVHKDLVYLPLEFSPVEYNNTDVVFLCGGHGFSTKYLAENKLPDNVRIIDLGNDFRLVEDAGEFVYGLPELSRELISQSHFIANPGCFATAMELGMLPLAVVGRLPQEITINGITGATGAGRKPTDDTHFSSRTANLSNYKVFSHQHLGEVTETLNKAGGGKPDIAFVPVRGCHARGILVNTVIRTTDSLEDLEYLYREYYKNHPFVYISDNDIYMKQVVNTNYCFIQLVKNGDKLLITSVIDNLLKGASGQAVQNMNLMFGLEETAGLRLKANYF
ncbi:MAG: N-acetyl-gamma-glutamyl-phosphate reductase [Culturomica sp.]|jgi:N-acetyl-gamma-glutamyl-phosphate reductase|nr:N-acetyl-gamma-glutamyl-phosphate reductase [Culturomica sp.]